MKSKKPNFLLIITDQQRADYLGCYGHPVLQTPNIDGIANRGSRFEHFFVASPVCMPNRASLMTGRMPSVHGVRSNGIPLAFENLTFVDLLKADGYQTALVGKSHLQNFVDKPSVLPEIEIRDDFSSLGEEYSQAKTVRLDTTEYQYESASNWLNIGRNFPDNFYGFDHVNLVTGHGDSVGGDYIGWLREREPNADKLMGVSNQLDHNYVCPQAVRTALPAELYSTTYIEECAKKYIKSKSKSEDPFFLKVSFPDPHHPFNPPGKYWDMYNPGDMPVPEAFCRTDWQVPNLIQSVLDARKSGSALLNGMNTLGVNKRESLEARALTCGMISMIDDAVGGILKALEDAGLDENTIIIFTSDHGDHLGDHKLLLKGAEQYLDILRVPFIYYDPRNKTERLVKNIGSTLDIAPTILDLAKINSYDGIQGKSMLPSLYHGNDVREFAFVQFDHQRVHPGLGQPPRVHSLVNDKWRLSVFANTDWGELYDLSADPGEFNNLWSEGSHRDIKCSLLESLARLEIEHVDRVIRPTGLA